MTNLSDLLPAGAASKQLDFTADGAIASGQTVILQSNGTVKAVEQTTRSASVGSATQITSNITENPSLVYDASSGKVVFTYIDTGNNNYATAAVGTISGTSISFGTPVVISSNAAEFLSTVYDSGSEKVIVIKKITANNYGYGAVGTVSGTAISFGSVTNFTTSSIGSGTAVTYDVTNNKVVIFYSDGGNSDRGTAKVGTVSGTTMSYGSASVFDTDACNWFGATYDSANGKVVVVHRGGSNIRAHVGTVSGTSVSFGSAATVNSGQTGEFNAIGYDVQSGKVVVAYEDRGNSYYGTAKVGTVSGTSVSFGSAVVFRTANTGNAYFVVAYDASVQRTNIFFRIYSPSNQGLVATGDVSGTSITFDSNFTVAADNRYTGAAYDSVNEKFGYYVRPGANDLDGVVFTTAGTSTNSANFVGIADAAISNAASGKITMKGGVATNSQLLPLAYTGSLGSAAVYQSTATEYQGIAFDSSNNKVVVAYKNDSNAQGTAAVGTVSGTGITWGTPVVFATASTSYCDVVFDSSNNKIVIVYSDVANSEYGTAIVGTVSGTSISFGSEVVFASAATTYIRAAFDSNENKVVVAYRDDGNSQYGTAIVGNVSGTSISFGTEVVFDSTGALSAAFGGFVFDSTNNKIVIPYTRSVSHCIVGTVSGTSISFGTKVDFGGTISYQNLSVAFDSNAGKVVINGRDSNNSDYFGSLVGTVSGTSISFGTQLVIEEVHTVGATAFDSSDNQIIYAYKDNSTSSAYYRLGTVSGTSISYGSASALTSGNVAYMDSTFDSSQNTTVIIYKDVANSNYGTARGVQVSGAYPSLVPNTTYYVQNDGTLSTTSSTVTAGKAMSTNSINLDYST